MADFGFALTYLLPHEGGLYEDDATGEVSNFGISLAWLKGIDKAATADTIKSLTPTTAGSLYRIYWWEARGFTMLNGNRLAAKVFDHTVNMGWGNEAHDDPKSNAPGGISIFQKILLCTPDGKIGPATARAANAASEQSVLDHYAEKIADYYRLIAQAFPVHQKDLPGWLARAAQMP